MCLLPYGKESSSKTPWNSQEIDLAIFSTIFFSWKFFGLNEKKKKKRAFFASDNSRRKLGYITCWIGVVAMGMYVLLFCMCVCVVVPISYLVNYGYILSPYEL